MPIPITCDCGKELWIKDDFAGKIVECPKCRESIAVPSMSFTEQIIEAQGLLESRSTGDRVIAIKKLSGITEERAMYLLESAFGDSEPRVVEEVFLVFLSMGEQGQGVIERRLREDTAGIATLKRLFNRRQSDEALELICRLVEEDCLGEQRLAELIPFLGSSKSLRAIDALEAIRGRYPRFEQIVKSELTKLQDPESGVKTLYRDLVSPMEKAGVMSCMTVVMAIAGTTGLIWFAM